MSHLSEKFDLPVRATALDDAGEMRFCDADLASWLGLHVCGCGICKSTVVGKLRMRMIAGVAELKAQGSLPMIRSAYGETFALLNLKQAIVVAGWFASEPALQIRDRLLASGELALADPALAIAQLAETLQAGAGARGDEAETDVVNKWNQHVITTGGRNYKLTQESFGDIAKRLSPKPAKQEAV